MTTFVNSKEVKTGQFICTLINKEGKKTLLYHPLSHKYTFLFINSFKDQIEANQKDI